jgi:DNA-binding beta-propeller fold protein YncE
MNRRLIATTVALALIAPLSLAAHAHADGLGTLGLASTEGATSPTTGERLVAIPTGRGPTKGTTVERLEQDGGELIDSRFLEQRLSIPAAAYDGTGNSLSADGTTLVLVPPFRDITPTHSTFVLVDTQRLTLRDHIRLDGAYSFDAVSPDGSRMYLIEYPSLGDPREYSVRAYDLRSNKLLPHPIVDPNEPPGEMQGFPMTRATSPDGRWAYTLYDGDKHPFIHALDTAGRSASISTGSTPTPPTKRDSARTPTGPS